MDKKKTVSLTILLLGLNTLVFGQAAVDPLADPPSPAFAGQTDAPFVGSASAELVVEELLNDLNSPRSIVTLPDGRILVAEGDGRLRVVAEDGATSEPIAGMPAIRSVNGRSLNDVAIDTGFAENRQLYMAYQAPPAGEAGGAKTIADSRAAAAAGKVFQTPKIVRARLSEDLTRLEGIEEIAEIAGRRLIPAPDGTVFVTTQGHGDFRPQVQKLDNTAGKILRVRSDGAAPPSNPFVNQPGANGIVFAIGHRDPDGGFIHPESKELWTIEHGPMGGDELNIIRPGQNSGWPENTYGKNYDGTPIAASSGGEGMTQPLYYWYPSIAPSGLMMYTGDLFPQWQGDVFLGSMSPTQGKFMVRLDMEGEKVLAEEHFLVERDRRVRALAQGNDGSIYVLTDSESNDQTNRHFKGQLLKITPK